MRGPRQPSRLAGVEGEPPAGVRSCGALNGMQFLLSPAGGCRDCAQELGRDLLGAPDQDKGGQAGQNLQVRLELRGLQREGARGG